MLKRAFFLLLFILGVHAVVFGVDAWIRINQQGYLPAARKKAILISESPMQISKFGIHDMLTGKELATFQTVTNKGEFAPFRNTFELDFSAFKTEGAFYIKAGLIYSPVIYINKNAYLSVADGLINYLRLQRSVSDTSRWAVESSGVKSVDSHIIVPEQTQHIVKSSSAKVKPVVKELVQPTLVVPPRNMVEIDGGWMESARGQQNGSVIAHVVSQLLFAYQHAPAAFADRCDAQGNPQPNQIPDVVDEAKWGLEWLLKMNPSPVKLYHQLGFIESSVGVERAAFLATGKSQGFSETMNFSNGIASIAGKYASAFALGAEVFSTLNPAFSELLYSKAFETFELGKKYPGVCQSLPGQGVSVVEDNWSDDMELAAALLYRLSYQGRYLKEAVSYGRMEPVSPWMCSDTMNSYQWYPYINLGHYLMANVENPRYRDEYVHNMANGIQRMQLYAKKNPFGVGVPMVKNSNGLVVALATQCRLYRSVTNDSSYVDMENALVDWLFGRNPWGSVMLQAGQAQSRMLLGGAEERKASNGVVLDENKWMDKTVERYQSDWAVFRQPSANAVADAVSFDGTASLTYLLSGLQNEGVPGKASDKNGYDLGAIVRTDVNKMNVSLMFCEDGYVDGYKVIRSALKKLHIQASFFFSPTFYARPRNKKIIRKLMEDNHYLGLMADKNRVYCSTKNRDSLLLTKTEFQNDLRKAYELMGKAGIDKLAAPFFLPAGRCYNDSIALWCRELGLQVLSYTPETLSYTDSSTPEMRENYFSSNEIYNKLLDSAMRAKLHGALLLFHLGSDKRRQDKFYPKIYSLLVDLSKAGYDFVNLYQSTDVVDKVKSVGKQKKETRK